MVVRAGLDLAAATELLRDLAPDDAASALDRLPGGAPDLARLAPAQQAELRAIIARIPADLRAFARPVTSPLDLQRVFSRLRALRFEPGRITSDSRFRLLSFLGAGGFGEVWEAEPYLDNPDFALLLPKNDSGRRALKFCRDATAAATLHDEIRVVIDIYRRLEDRTGLVGFEPLALQATRPKPARRYADMGEMAQALVSAPTNVQAAAAEAARLAEEQRKAEDRRIAEEVRQQRAAAEARAAEERRREERAAREAEKRRRSEPAKVGSKAGDRREVDIAPGMTMDFPGGSPPGRS